MAQIRASGILELLESIARSRKPKALIWLEDMCENVGEGFVWGSLLGTVFDFFRGMFISPKGKRLTGGLSYVRKNGVFHHGPIVAAHCGALTLFDTLIPNSFKLVCALTFGAVRFFRTQSPKAAAKSAVTAFLLAFAFTKTFADPTKREDAEDAILEIQF